jgi:hypothetical protein
MDGRTRKGLVLAGLLVAVLVAAAGCAGRGQGKPAAVPADAASVYRVSAPLVNVLACPSHTCEVVEDLGDGARVAVTAVIPGGWVEVRCLDSGRAGYVLARFLSKP